MEYVFRKLYIEQQQRIFLALKRHIYTIRTFQRLIEIISNDAINTDENLFVEYWDNHWAKDKKSTIEYFSSTIIEHSNIWNKNLRRCNLIFKD